MFVIVLKTECEKCGGDAYMSQTGTSNEVIIEFIEETAFLCDCGTETYLYIDKRIVEKKNS